MIADKDAKLLYIDKFGPSQACMDPYLFYLRDNALCGPGDYDSTKNSLCSLDTSTGDDGPELSTLYMLSKNLQCFECDTKDMLFSN